MKSSVYPQFMNKYNHLVQNAPPAERQKKKFYDTFLIPPKKDFLQNKI